MYLAISPLMSKYFLTTCNQSPGTQSALGYRDEASAFPVLRAYHPEGNIEMCSNKLNTPGGAHCQWQSSAVGPMGVVKSNYGLGNASWRTEYFNQT